MCVCVLKLLILFFLYLGLYIPALFTVLPFLFFLSSYFSVLSTAVGAAVRLPFLTRACSVCYLFRVHNGYVE